MAQRTGSANALGKYKLIAELGRGGMAEVFLAVVQGPAGFNKLMVVKRLRPNLAEEPEFLEMFMDEARLAAKLSHPNIVQTMEVGEDDGQFYISMEYLQGQPLNRILRRCPDVTPTMVLRVLADALEGLHAAHELRDFNGRPLLVVHRDATPHNIFLTYPGQVKVVDFGIAKAAVSVAETRTGVLKGKVAYMAPEQARGEPVDRRADIFSLGCCLWEAVAQQRIWHGKSDIQILNAMMGEAPIPSPRTVRPDVDPTLERIVMTCLAMAPEGRFATARDLRVALTKYLDGTGDRTTPRDAAVLVAARFADEREKLRGLIEAQTRQIHVLPTGQYAHLELPHVGGSGPHPAGDRRGSSSSIPPPGPWPTASEAPPPVKLHSSHPDPTTGSNSGPGTGTQYATATATIAPAPRTRRLAVLAGLGAVAAVVFIAGAFIILRRPGAPSVTSDAEPGPVVAAPSAAPEGDTGAPDRGESVVTEVELSVEADPPGATVYLDGVEVGTTPFSGRYPPSDVARVLTLEAEGYQTLRRDVRLDQSRGLHLSLLPEAQAKKDPVVVVPPRPAAAAAPRPPPAAVPVPSSSDAPDAAPSSFLDPRKKPENARTIDDDNPYR
ncbi:MAG: serine/threonine-protein kinase [Myxococcota bacterium]